MTTDTDDAALTLEEYNSLSDTSHARRNQWQGFNFKPKLTAGGRRAVPMYSDDLVESGGHSTTGGVGSGDSLMDWNPPAPTVNKEGKPYLTLCTDCMESAVEVGQFCEVCAHRRKRRGA